MRKRRKKSGASFAKPSREDARHEESPSPDRAEDISGAGDAGIHQGRASAAPQNSSKEQEAEMTKHGMSYTAEYRCWLAIKSRCLNPKCDSYADYGAIGVRICARWRNSFEKFFADVGRRPSPKHSIDRFPNRNGHYTPKNVRWATVLQQQNNRRNTIFVKIGRKRVSLAEACRFLKLTRNVVWMRIDRGMSPQKAISKSTRKYGEKRCG
jgi:hypothetical protein